MNDDVAGDQRAVVGRIVPALRIGRQELHQLLAVFQRLADGRRLDLDLALGVDQFGAERGEDRARRIDVVGRGAEADAERLASLEAGLGGLQHGLVGPRLCLGSLGHVRRRIHLHDVDAGKFLHHADARGRALVLGAPARRHGDPLALDLAQVVGHRIGFAILGDQPADHVIDILELVGVVPHVPVADGDDVVTAARLRLGVDGQQRLAGPAT